MTELLEMLLDAVPHRGDLDDGAASSVRRGTDSEHIRQRAFGHHEMRLIMSNQDTQALAQKIIGDLVHLPVAGQVKLAMGADGCIDRVRKAGLVKSVEIRVEKDVLPWSAFHIKAGLD